MRRIDCAAAEDHLARGGFLPLDPALAKRDPGAALAVEQQPGDNGVGLDLEVAAAAGFAQECLRRRAAPLAAPRHLRVRDAFLLLAVVVGGGGIAGLLRRLDKAVGQIEDRAVILDDQRPALAAVFRIAGAAIGLRLAEERQYLV